MSEIPLIIRPIDRWPRAQTTARKDNPFRSGMRWEQQWENGQYVNKPVNGRDVPWSTTRADLDRELRQLGVREAIIQIAVSDRDIRLDGELRADARPSHPGVVISFATAKHGALSYACDAFTDWRANVRGIAKGLEALRLVDRYGISHSGEQYVGWKAIGSGTPMGPGGQAWTADEAAEWLAKMATDAGMACDTDDIFGGHLDAAYREVAKRLHPDVEGGSAEAFRRLGEARDLLRLAGA